MSESEDIDVTALQKANTSVPGGRFSEHGTTGLRRTDGFIYEEFLTQLQGERGRRIFREMGSNDPVIHGLLFAIAMFIRRADWTIRAPEGMEDDAQAQEAVEFIEGAYDDLAHSMPDHWGEVSTMFTYGWAGFEIVYKRRSGDNSNPEKHSKFDDGMIGWAKFAPRGQNTLWEWIYDEDSGRLVAFEQLDTDSSAGLRQGPTKIPLVKMLHYRTESVRDNPEGKSVLRGAYRPWYFKKRIEEIEAIGVERDLAGLPVIHAPAELFGKDANESQKALLSRLKTMVKEVRRDESDGVVFPMAYDREGNLKFKFELLSSGGSRQMNTSEIIERYSRQAAMSVLADFILIGHEKVGSFALTDAKTDAFSLALDAWLDVIAEVHTRQAIPRLLMLNGFDLEVAPRMTFDPVKVPSIEELSDYIVKLSKAGAPVFPDETLQAWMYEQAGLPEPDPQESAAGGGLGSLLGDESGTPSPAGGSAQEESGDDAPVEKRESVLVLPAVRSG